MSMDLLLCEGAVGPFYLQGTVFGLPFLLGVVLNLPWAFDGVPSPPRGGNTTLIWHTPIYIHLLSMHIIYTHIYFLTPSAAFWRGPQHEGGCSLRRASLNGDYLRC